MPLDHAPRPRWTCSPSLPRQDRRARGLTDGAGERLHQRLEHEVVGVQRPQPLDGVEKVSTRTCSSSLVSTVIALRRVQRSGARRNA